MSNENCNVEIKEEKCLCQSKWFKKFMIIALGSFVGVFLALSLFSALHNPPMMYPGHYGCPCGCQMMMKHQQHHHFDRGERGPRGDFHRANQERIGQKTQMKIEVDD